MCAFSRDVGCYIETIDGVEDEGAREGRGRGGGGGGSERTKNMARVHVERVDCLFARLVLPPFLFFCLYFVVVRCSRIVDRVECRSL